MSAAGNAGEVAVDPGKQPVSSSWSTRTVLAVLREAAEQ